MSYMNVKKELIVAYWRRHTLIIVRRTPAAPKTALAGVMLEISFARFRASMAALSKGRGPSGPFCCGNSDDIVEISGAMVYGGEGRPAAFSAEGGASHRRSRAEAAPNVHEWTIEFRLQPPLSQTAFSTASQFTPFSFSYPPTPAPVIWLLCSYSIIRRYERAMTIHRYTQSVEEIPPSRAAPRPTELALGPAKPLTHLSLILSVATS